MADLLGKEISQKIKEEVHQTLLTHYSQGKRRAKMTVLLVGNDEGSRTYVASMEKVMAKMDIDFSFIPMEECCSEDEVLRVIDSLNEDESVDGIFIQVPLPRHITTQKVVERIAPHKDIDGLHPFNLGRIMIGQEAYVPCTPKGVHYLLKSCCSELSGKRAVVIGRSISVGKPMVFLLERENMTVTLCHSRTQNMKEIASQADVLVVAIGKAEYIDASYVKEGAIVIDVGINRNEAGKLVGDVDYESVKDIASYITPVPGGVGSMTTAMLVKNILQAYELHVGR
ncbi:MAG: bifunctional 5,10-methylenetetrahydrofolate dehydrogenase/5,10-methenyltetrahydrofolate cyclohydrolase [Erysipelotrichales bacterium]|nr:bifunctional 5,10-methylenetetrahydrofolate dehydrogenase/5,10-methenyltetrahydrofolate cyclohydrolase [Erysipelotrichales bacterium]